jgi:hypothetical protein
MEGHSEMFSVVGMPMKRKYEYIVRSQNKRTVLNVYKFLTDITQHKMFFGADE